MANELKLYQGNPTAGGTDGTAVSEGTGAAPISFTLNATNNQEGTAQKLALRCAAGLVTVGNTVLALTGTTAAKWALAPDNAGAPGAFGAYGAGLTIATAIGDTNTVLWVKAKATNDEAIANDTTVDISVTADVGAV